MSERKNQGAAGRKRPSTPADDAARERAQELVRTGMPPQMAHAVARGKMSLSDAVERMARRDQVNRLIEQHELSRALATQVALGQADLEVVLARRRLEDHRETNRERSVLIEREGSPDALTFHLHGDRRLTATVLKVDRYDVLLQPHSRDGQAEAAPELVHKLQLKLAFDPRDYKMVRKGMKRHKVLQKQPLAPIERPQDRYGCSDKRLFRYVDGEVQVQATLLEGEILRGALTWFSRFELGMSVKGGGAVVLFRHALHDLREV